MASSKITLIAMNVFFLNMHDDLFRNLTVPTGLNKQTLTDNILLKGGEFEVAYADPTATQNLIGIWSRKMQPTFTRWVDALAIDYAPLENYDRNEFWHDVTDEDGTSHLEGTGSSDSAGTSNQTVTTNTSGSSDSTGTVNTDTSGTSELTKSAYDQSAYSPYEKTINDESVDTSTSDSTTTTGTSSTTDGITTSDETDTSMENNGTTTMDRDFEHRGRVHGNIGVTTSQQMLQQELDLGYWNVYDKITELFLQEFVIPVYS